LQKAYPVDAIALGVLDLVPLDVVPGKGRVLMLEGTSAKVGAKTHERIAQGPRIRLWHYRDDSQIGRRYGTVDPPAAAEEASSCRAGKPAGDEASWCGSHKGRVAVQGLIEFASARRAYSALRW
jgi:hypothetical protein